MKLVEIVVALLIGALLMVAGWRSTSVVRTGVDRLQLRAARGDAHRVVGLLLDLDGGGLVGATGRPNEVSVRAHRWWGATCDTTAAPGRALARVQGLRQPDPDKDSVMVVSAAGGTFLRRLEGVRRGAICDGEGVELVWTPEDGEAAAVALRGFEHGAYRLDNAFRYGRGRGGAQPLTAEVFPSDSVELRVDSAEVVLQMGSRPPRRWPVANR